MGERPVQFSSLLIERPKLERAILDSRHRNDFGIVSGREDFISLQEILVSQGLLYHLHAGFAQQPDHSLASNARQKRPVRYRGKNHAVFRHKDVRSCEFRDVPQ